LCVLATETAAVTVLAMDKLPLNVAEFAKRLYKPVPAVLPKVKLPFADQIADNVEFTKMSIG
jgi:hypothetical protein